METENDLKKKYAGLLLKHVDEPFKAALELFPKDVAFALKVATEWVIDPIVCEFKVTLMNDSSSDGEEFLPQKYEVLTKLWVYMHRKNIDPGEYARLMNLYMQGRGWIGKNSSGKLDEGNISDIFAEIAKNLPA